MSARLGTLTLDLVAKTGNFTAPIEKSKKQIKKDFKEMADQAKVLGAAFGALAVAGGALFAKLTKDGLAAVDAQAKVARSLDTTYDSITALSMAFGDAGIDNFESSLNRLNRRLGAAELGRGSALKAVQELNLNLNELSQVQADERLALIADRIQQVSTNSQQAARYAQDLGFEQRQAAQFFLQGGDAIRKYSDEVEALGLSLTEIETAQVEAANDALGIFGDIIQSVNQRLAVEAAPILQAFASQLETAIINIGGLDDASSTVFSEMVDAIAFVADSVDGLSRVFKIAANILVDDFASGIASIIELVASLAEDLNNVPTIIKPIGLLISDDDVKNLKEAAALQRSVANQATEEVEALLNTPLAGQALKDNIKGIKEEAESTADALIQSRKAISDTMGSAPITLTGEADFGKTINFAQDEITNVDLIAERYEELQQIAESTSESLRTPQEIFQQEIELLNELRETRQSNSDEMLISQQDYMRGVDEAQKRLAESTKDTENEMSQFSIQAARNMQSAFADFLFDPFEKGLDGLLQSFIQTLQRMIAEAAAAKIFEGIGGALAGSTGGVGAFFGSFFGGARAMGGPVDSSKAYLVGERGPELFSPSSNGYITNNSDLMQGSASGGDVVVNVSVDAKGDNVSSSDNQGAQLGRMIAASVKSILIEEKRPGGLLNG